jgi:hypothetical protein
VQVLADSAYGSGEALTQLQARGHEAIIKPWPVSVAVAGGFTTDDFLVDEAKGTVTCPNGVSRPINNSRTARFGAALNLRRLLVLGLHHHNGQWLLTQP